MDTHTALTLIVILLILLFGLSQFHRAKKPQDGHPWS